MQKLSAKTFYKLLGWTIGTPIVLFLLLAFILYLPPVQQWAVNYFGKTLSEQTGLRFEVGSVRLAFPLRLSASHIVATDAAQDTLLAAKELGLKVELLPLFDGEARVEGIRLKEARLNTKQQISDVQMSGYIGSLTVDAPGIRWAEGKVPLEELRLENTDLYIQLADTAKEDSVKTPSIWNISLDEARILQSNLLLSLPGDSMHIGLAMGDATLERGGFDLGEKKYTLRRISWKKGGIYYDMSQPAEAPAALAALRYRTTGKHPLRLPQKELTPSHLHFTQLVARLDNFSFDSLGTLLADVRHFQFQERSGWQLERLSGKLRMDKTALKVDELIFRTPYSSLTGGLLAGMEAPQRHHIELKGSIGHEDILSLGAPYLTAQQRRDFPRKPLELDVALTGTMKHLSIARANLAMPNVLRLSTKGWVKNVDAEKRKGDFSLHLTAFDLRPLLRFAGQDLDKTVRIPNRTQLKGKVGFAGTHYSTDLLLNSAGGSARLKGDVNTASEQYALRLTARQLPLQRILPAYAGSALSGSTSLRGKGFDVLSSKAYLESRLQIDRFTFSGYDLSNFRFDGSLQGSKAKGNFRVRNAMLQAEGHTQVQLGKRIDLQLQTTLEAIDLHRMNLVEEPMILGGTIDLTAHTNRTFTTYGLHGIVDDPTLQTATKGTTLSDMSIDLESNVKQTEAQFSAGDLAVAFHTKGDVTLLASKLQRFVQKYQHELAQGRIHQEKMRKDLPQTSLTVTSGSNNPISAYCRLIGYQWRSLYFYAQTDPHEGINGLATMGGLRIQGLQIDTVNGRIITDSTGLQLHAMVENTRKRNPNQFSLSTRAYLLDDGGGFEATFQDGRGRIGLQLGAEGHFEKGGMRFHLYPQQPIVAYRQFTINEDNFIYLSHKGFYNASINLLADDGTGVKIQGVDSDSLTDISINLHRLNLNELTAALPMLPAMGGYFSGDLHWQDNHKEQSMMMDLHTKGLEYEGAQLGNVDLQGILLPKADKVFYTSAFISVDGVESMAFNGTYAAKGEGSIEGTASLTHFPTKTLNGFLAGTDVMLDGDANGEIHIKGNPTAPLLNGELDLGATTVYSPVYGFSYKMDQRPLVFENSHLYFDNYRLTSGTKEPLTINGGVDLSNPTVPRIDLALDASNFQLVNAKKNKQSMVYGKIYSDFKGTVRGTAEKLSLRGILSILPTTDMTYILKDSPLNTDDELKGLVEFTSFTDTIDIPEKEEAHPSSVDVRLNINISEAAKFHCDLSADGKSYIDLYGGGNLSFLMTRQGDMRLQGRFTMNEGEMEYEMPLFPLKKFQIEPGSYINFTGDPMNPRLNITATQTTKAVVSDNDQQRSVEFKVGMNVTQTLEKMGLTFTIEAPSDLAVTNELGAMSKEERGKVAVGMLATGMYLTEQSLASGTGFKATNALNAFLQSEIQQIAGDALKTVDIRLGVESGTGKTGSTTTDYSFQFSKRFMDNRLTVNIGGKVSTGADAVNDGTSFIDNISIEYRLDQVGSRHIRLFYDRDTRDPFEGLLTQTGLGLVLRKKTNHLGELFLLRRKKQKK